jgi:hypothetical protein
MSLSKGVAFSGNRRSTSWQSLDRECYKEEKNDDDQGGLAYMYSLLSCVTERSIFNSSSPSYLV